MKKILEKVKNREYQVGDLIDLGICPTCFDKENNHILYGDNRDKMLYEDNDIEVFFDSHPKSIGHTIILSKVHYKDMMEIPDSLCEKVFVFSKKLMNIIKKVYGCESVYLCTMCDGKNNHFHVQLIPRYINEKRGSGNFVKERKKYLHDENKIKKIKELIDKYGDFNE